MQNQFPCPNPTCTHVFTPEAIKGAGAVRCPKCGTVYQFRNANAPAKTAPPKPSAPARPAGQAKGPPSSPKMVPPKVPPPVALPPVMPPPVAMPPVVLPPAAPPRTAPPVAATTLDFGAPIAPPAPPSSRAAAPDIAFDSYSTPEKSTRGKKKKRRKSGSKFAGLLIFLLLTGAVGGSLYYFWDDLPIHGDDDQAKNSKAQGNFSIAMPRSWRNDAQIRPKFRAQIAASRAKPPGHFVLVYQDYGTRSPTDGELFDAALKKLRGYFRQIEYINPFEQEGKGGNTELAGEPGITFTFSATDNEVPMKGECYMLTRRGYAYWLFFWGPEEFGDQLAEEFAGLRAKFKVYNEREGWKPQPRDTKLFVGTDLVPYQLNYATEVWTAEANSRDADPSADLFMRGFEPTEDEATGQKRVVRLAGNSADVRVLHLPAASSLAAAVKNAQEYIRKNLQMTNPDAKIETIIERKTGKAIIGKEVGAFPGQVDRLHLQLGPDTEKFGLLAVARRPTGLLVIYGECQWDRRDYWEQEFKALLETVRPAKMAP